MLSVLGNGHLNILVIEWVWTKRTSHYFILCSLLHILSSEELAYALSRQFVTASTDGVELSGRGVLLNAVRPGVLLGIPEMSQLGTSLLVVLLEMVRQRALNSYMYRISSISIPQLLQSECLKRLESLDKCFTVLVRRNEELISELSLSPLTRHNNLVLAGSECVMCPVARSIFRPRLHGLRVRYYPAAFDRSGSSQSYKEDGCHLDKVPFFDGVLLKLKLLHGLDNVSHQVVLYSLQDISRDFIFLFGLLVLYRGTVTKFNPR